MKTNARKIVPFICAGALWIAAASCAERTVESGNNQGDTTSGITNSPDVSVGVAGDPGNGSDDNTDTPDLPEFDKSDFKVFLENTSVPFGTENILIKYEYVGEEDKNICFGVEFELEKLVGGNWEKVEFGYDAAFIEIGLILGSESRTHTTEVSLSDNFYKTPLTKGDYRVIKNVGNLEYTLDFSIV